MTIQDVLYTEGKPMPCSFATTYTQGYNLGEAGTTGGQNNYTSGRNVA